MFPRLKENGGGLRGRDDDPLPALLEGRGELAAVRRGAVLDQGHLDALRAGGCGVRRGRWWGLRRGSPHLSCVIQQPAAPGCRARRASAPAARSFQPRASGQPSCLRASTCAPNRILWNLGHATPRLRHADAAAYAHLSASTDVASAVGDAWAVALRIPRPALARLGQLLNRNAGCRAIRALFMALKATDAAEAARPGHSRRLLCVTGLAHCAARHSIA